jgi:hypothetical protein
MRLLASTAKLNQPSAPRIRRCHAKDTNLLNTDKTLPRMNTPNTHLSGTNIFGPERGILAWLFMRLAAQWRSSTKS